MATGSDKTLSHRVENVQTVRQMCFWQIKICNNDEWSSLVETEKMAVPQTSKRGIIFTEVTQPFIKGWDRGTIEG